MAKINLTYEQLTDISTRITNGSKEISSLWRSIRTKEIDRIKNAWIGVDCDAYVSKIEEMNGEMQKAINALNLLADAYTKAKDEVADAQQKLANSLKGV